MDRLVDDALDEVESLRAFGLGRGEVRAVGLELAGASGLNGAAESALAGAGSTVFDVANAVTAVARAWDGGPAGTGGGWASVPVAAGGIARTWRRLWSLP